ncbi:alginate export family protein [Catenovulum sp. 2E275]|uniref:alginate export family protein n=1 Tax=Catenovulum sp. 2E275 TaxID=2980497 RepID=UPI0021CF6067|nr:alginate export family protein [Catenovulum sp. 2E275]MCU4676794.1 alginate export family protein [Catenovulum sp. 2E275]
MEIKKSKLALAIFSLISTGAVTLPSYAASTLSEAITEEGKASLALRARYEGVEQAGKAEDAKAMTLKSSLTLATGSYKGFSALIQGDMTSSLGPVEYNDTLNGRTQYPVVADPIGGDINQAFLKYTNEQTQITLGRQIITHLNHRFIGHVGWRQNMQTYDGVRIQTNLDAVKLDYSYLINNSTIFGTDVEIDAHNLLASYSINPEHSISGFAYLYEQNDVDTNTYGFDYTGKMAGITAHASYAIQSQSAGDYDVDYFALDFSYKIAAINFTLGYEALGSDDGAYGFQTPLATKHAFNGFADKFLATPAGGLEDIYIKAVYKYDALTLIAFYHDFSAAEGNTDYGQELDLVASYQINQTFSVLAKYADYNGDAGDDISKTWLQLEAKF